MTSEPRGDLPDPSTASDDEAARAGVAMGLDASVAGATGPAGVAGAAGAAGSAGTAGAAGAAGPADAAAQAFEPAASSFEAAALPAEPVNAEAVTVDPLVPPTPVGAGIATPAEQPAAQPSRRGAVARGGLRFIQFAVGVGLFVFGIWIGVQAFQMAQKPSDTENAQVVSNGIPTPPVVQEFADALGSGGPDAVRSSVTPDVFALLVGEVQRDQIATIKKVDVLGTAVDGTRTATGLVLTSTLTDGTTLWVNLIVQTEDGKITTLR
jgi:hypothetical protein